MQDLFRLQRTAVNLSIRTPLDAGVRITERRVEVSSSKRCGFHERHTVLRWNPGYDISQLIADDVFASGHIPETIAKLIHIHVSSLLESTENLSVFFFSFIIHAYIYTLPNLRFCGDPWMWWQGSNSHAKTAGQFIFNLQQEISKIS